MKKIAFFNALILSILICTGMLAMKIFDKKDIFSLCHNYQEVTIVTKQNIDCNGNKVSNGNLNYYTFDANSTPKHTFDAEGIVFYFKLNVPFQYFQKIFGSSLTNPTKVQGREVYYAYHDDFNKYVVHKNKKVNAQLAKTPEGWILGFPLILTGF